MAYLGRGLDKISNIEVLDNITFDGSSSYSITKGSVAFTPNSAQSLLISIDGVVQATNFTVSSSTIDFGVAIPSTSVCNFFLHYGTGVMTVPSDGSVTTAKLGDGAVTSAKLSGLGNYVVEKIDTYNVGSQVSTTSTSAFTYFDIANGNTLNFTPTSTNDIIYFVGHTLTNFPDGRGVGLGIMRATSSSITSSDTSVAAQGVHAQYLTGATSVYHVSTISHVETNLSAGTTYYYELYGLLHAGSGTRYFNREVANSIATGRDRFTGIHFKYIG